MRDVHHDNLAQFMGACVETSNICILFQYGSKGSLQVKRKSGLTKSSFQLFLVIIQVFREKQKR